MHRSVHTTTFFFDFDGTLADSIPVLYTVYANFLKKFAVTATKEEFETLNGPSLAEIIALLKKRYNLEGSPESLLALYHEVLRESYSRDVLLKENALPVLAELKKRNCKTWLVTSSSKDLVTVFLEHYQMYPYFDGYVFGEEVQRSKPSPDIYLLAMQKAGVQAGEIITVEDSANGIQSAKAAGTCVIALAGTHSAQQLATTQADHVIYNLNEIINLLGA